MKGVSTTFIIILIVAVLIGIFAVYQKLTPSPALPVIIESISPPSGTVGTEITIRGSGFTPDNNDIAFVNEKINFQGSHSAFLNNIPSSNGETLTFTLPDVLGACAFSQMKPDQMCPAIGLSIPAGTNQISVINKNGRSNTVNFILEAE